MDEAALEPPGWYGKLPSLGDFASRRLSPDFIEAWDGWLAAGIAEWRAREPQAWLPAYLSCPSWRFVLMPGVVPGSAPDALYAGVLLPSVDRVGRYFPLTVVWPLPALPHDGASLNRLLQRLHQIDDLAVDALQDDWSIEQLEAGLAQLAAASAGDADQGNAAAPAAGPAQLPVAPLPLPDALSARECEPAGELAASFACWAAQALGQQWQACALWLSDPGTGRRRLRVTQGLPVGREFAQLLGAPADEVGGVGGASSGADAGVIDWD